MNILIFSHYYPPEPPPPAQHLSERAQLWAQQGHQVWVVTNHPSYPHGKIYRGYQNRWLCLEKEKGVQVVRIWTWPAPQNSRCRRFISHLAFALVGMTAGFFLPKFDVVLASSPPLFAAWLAHWFAASRRIPWVLEIRDLWPDSILAPGTLPYRFFKKLERHLYRSAKAVLATCHEAGRHIKKEGAHKVFVIPSGVRVEMFTAAKNKFRSGLPKKFQNKFIVGYPGTLGTAHDIPLLLATARQLLPSRIRFLIIGAGPYFARLVQGSRLSVKKMFCFRPQLLHSKMPMVWRNIDACLILLKSEARWASAMPNKIFEAMATGTPLLFAGPKGAAQRLIQKKGLGLVVTAGRPESLASAAQRMLEDHDLYQGRRRNCLRTAESFNRKIQSNRTLKILKLVTARGFH